MKATHREAIHRCGIVAVVDRWKQTDSNDDNESFRCFQEAVNCLKKVFDTTLTPDRRAFNEQIDFQIVDNCVKFIVESVCGDDEATSSTLTSSFWIEIAKYQTSVFRAAQKGEIQQRFVTEILPNLKLNKEEKEEEEEEDGEDLCTTKDMDEKEDQEEDKETDEENEGDDENEEEEENKNEEEEEEEDTDMFGDDEDVC